ncbi:NrfD/PsrC family molybdoenzyme membrane anchor subunit [Natronorubrum daqingense]|uniref:Prokaryotic molybdopterin-containing oxidoreductase family, membrane subunit n=1 Tax=Natronorubrum daqingense TaxID=588898 RepID=A0A1N7DVT8_9EURY|nr:NrfD/PsrC family molybdoenzyme membrane anchor subunit [Natronorubrum daqingense]APX96205.1 hypothetical protein BB347_05960 [Natronorubrum daqingense]SIR79908.1 prokaryotic molybdopterin-containing oxidoreductase family, membrane subunit [Natronorubrum daqingense]
MTDDVPVERVLRPLHTTTWKFLALLVLLGLGMLLFLEAWITQLRNGLIMTGLGDWGTGGGVPWGMYIGSFIWWVGIAHGGIAVSAAVRVFKMDQFEPIARIGEIVTLVALPMAAANIVFDLGGPDRLINTMIMWPQTVHHSPLAWDVAVVSLYLVLSMTYLTLTMRAELYALMDRVPRYLRPVYGLLLLGYRPEEDEKAEQMAYWLAIAILALVPLLSGGVVPWLFSLVGAQPGWFGAATGPAMLFESLASAIAFVIVVGAAFRYAYDWEFIDDAVFRGLTKALTVLSMAVLWFLLHDTLSGVYAAPVQDEALTETLLTMPLFWVAVAGITIPALYMLATIVRPSAYSLPAVVAGAISVSIAIWIKKLIFVVEGLLYPTTPPLANLYPTGSYSPTAIEWVVVVSTVVIAALLIALATKIIPMVELDPEEI